MLLCSLALFLIGAILTAISQTFGKWTGLLQISAGVAALIGPTLVGMITDKLSWRYFYWATVPMAVLCAILVIIGIPGRTQRIAHRIDYAGASTAGCCLLFDDPGIFLCRQKPLGLPSGLWVCC